MAGVILLAGMYLVTLLAAIFDSSASQGLLKASITVTIFVPVFLYAMILVGRYTKGREEEEQEKQK